MDPLLIFGPADINRKLAYAAHYATSFDPDKRADQEVQGYLEEMQAMVDLFIPFVTSDNEAGIRADLAKYKEGYIKYLHAKLAADSRTMSSMITGPSNFPVRRNQKRLDTAHKRLEEFLDWTKRFRERMLKTYDPCRVSTVIRSDDADALDKLRAKIEQAEQAQELMVKANKIVRGKLTNEAKVAALVELGLTQELLAPDVMGCVGFPPYALTNNNANIHRLKDRLAQLEREQARPVSEDKETTVLGQPCRVVENQELTRLQLFFDGKPPETVRDQLKRNGFHWSPREGAWQRLLNEGSRRAVAGMSKQ